MTSQLVLPFPVSPHYGADAFAVSDANRDAHAWVARWPEWPGGGLWLHGDSGSGKTHLAHVWAARADAAFAAPDALERWAGHPPAAVVVEDVDRIPHSERALLHAYNAIRARGGTLLFTAREAPAHLAFALPDLASRLRGLPAVRLHAPDDALLTAVLRKHFADRQLAVSDEALGFLVARMERSFAAARALAARIDARAVEEGRRVTLPWLRDIDWDIKQGDAPQ